MKGSRTDAAWLITAWEISHFPDGHDKVWVSLVHEDKREDDVRSFVCDVGSEAELADDLVGDRVVGSIDELAVYLQDHDDDVFSGSVIA